MTDWLTKGKDATTPATRLLQRWIPFIVSVILTPVALVLGVLSAGSGHGNYLLAKIIFPYTMLSTVLFNSITNSFLFIAVAQLPLYGLFLTLKNKKKIGIYILLVIHILSASLCIFFVGEGFS